MTALSVLAAVVVAEGVRVRFPALLELSCFCFRGCTSTSPSAPGLL